jgi:hypothetical protein
MSKSLKTVGQLSHINPREDRLLAELLPKYHGEVITRGLLADAGQGGDDRLTLVTPEEAALLKLAGGSGLPNRLTGLLAFEDGDGTGTSGGGGGEGGDNGVGGNDSGGPGSGGGGGGGYGGSVGGDTGFGDHSSLGGPESEIGGPGMGYGGFGFDPNTSFFDTFDPTVPDSEIGFAAAQPNWNEYNFVNYAPKDTWQRVFQEWWDPSLPSAGRFSAPTRDNLGFLTDMMGHLGFGALGKGVMGFGAAMGRAQSIDQQNQSMAHNQALGGMNSTGRDQDTSTGLGIGDMGLQPTGGGLLGQPQQPVQTIGTQPGNGLLSDSPTQVASTTPTVVVVEKDNDRAKEWMEYIWSGEVNPRRWLV